MDQLRCKTVYVDLSMAYFSNSDLLRYDSKYIPLTIY